MTAQCVTRNTCADGSSVAHCLMDPCRTAFCPQYPNAICQSDFCGGCNHRFIDPFSRSDVTRRCSRGKYNSYSKLNGMLVTTHSMMVD